MYPKMELPSTKALISSAASAAATVMLVRSVAKDFIPAELRHYLFSKFQVLLATFSNEITIVIDEFDGLNRNQLFHAAHLYVGTIATPSSTRRLRASLPEKEKKIRVSLGGNEEIIDKFSGIHLKWRLVTKQTQQARYVSHYSGEYQTSEIRYFELTFHKKHKNTVIDEYLPYVLEKSKAVKEGEKTLKLHTLRSERMHGPGSGRWQFVTLDHPANFETLAMDDEIKSTIIDDLDRFVQRRDLYRKVGKAWKRGYLLFGPPGTGKSSLIAAMANYLNFDVYDLELTDIRCNSDLRRLLISTANRSILVVEDIDASIDLSERKNKASAKPSPSSPSPFYPFQHDPGPKVTLSGLLNFIDGLWSSCGDERIIIFTTNHKDKLDPALLRPGRMDVHIRMSYCTPCGFKILANNYLGTSEHPLLLKAEGLIASTKVTPAEVGEQLLKSDDPEVALEGLIKFLENKKEAEFAGDKLLENEKEADLARDKLLENKKEADFAGDIKCPAIRGVMLKTNKNADGLKELMKMAELSPGETSPKIIKKDEAVNALKILMKFLGEEIGAGNVKDCGTSLGSSAVTLPESEKEDGTKID